MAAETISVSGFHLRFEFAVLDFIKIIILIEGLGDIGVKKFTKFKNYLNELQKRIVRNLSNMNSLRVFAARFRPGPI